MQQMTQRLIKRLSALGQYEEAVAELNAAAAERPAALKSKQASGQRSDVLSVCDDPFILAQQLTHIELVSIGQLVHSLGGWGGVSQAGLSKLASPFSRLIKFLQKKSCLCFVELLCYTVVKGSKILQLFQNICLSTIKGETGQISTG